MPYVTEHRRIDIDNATVEELTHWYELTAGDLNYLFSRIIWAHFKKKKSYAKANELIGALECCKLELYRRHVAPYEDSKIKSNGDLK